ncbi:MAG: acetate uptake transporter [Spirochaetes bacterium]|nr:acetate uptake transporter [Spirochaetota bacterium]
MSNNNLANPAPLGLMGFGMTTILLNIHNAGFYPLDTMILAMGFFYGGLAQIIAGIMEFKKGNTFGVVAFTSYGLFWQTLVFLLIVPNTPLWTARPSEPAMIMYFFCWGVFTLGLFFGTLKGNRGTQVVFLTLFILFFLLAIRDITKDPTIAAITGWEGIFCGASAFYVAIAEVLNEKFGRTVLPLGEPKA